MSAREDYNNARPTTPAPTGGAEASGQQLGKGSIIAKDDFDPSRLGVRTRRSLRDRMNIAGEAARDRLARLWGRPNVRRGLVSALALVMISGSAFAYVHLRPRAVPDVFEDDLADVLDYTLLSDAFNSLSLEERLKLLKDVIGKLKGMDSGDSALVAAFAAGISGSARDQLQKNVEKLGVDLWDKFSIDYSKVSAQEREAYLDQAFIEFTKMMEEISGFSTGMDDNERLERAREQAKRDQAAAQRGAPSNMNPEAVTEFMTFINDRGTKLTSPEQRGRMALFGRDMTRRLRGQDVSTGRPK